MVKKSITYFEQNGPENTDEVLKLVHERLKEGDIKSVVVASTSGKTIAVGGTGIKGRGTDTAVVVLPSYTNNFFDFRVLEIIAKPFNNG